MPLSRITSPFQSSTANVYSPSANTITFRAANADKVTIDSDGLGIGTTNPTQMFHVVQTNQSPLVGYIDCTGSSQNFRFRINSTDNASSVSHVWSYSHASINKQASVYLTGAGGLAVQTGQTAGSEPTANVTSALFNQYGMGIGGAAPSSGYGITFPASQSASSDPNTLDDYEEGTWTPSYVSSGSTWSYAARSGAYVKIGQMVYAQFYLYGTVSGTTTNECVVSGLPFASFNDPVSSSYHQAAAPAWFTNSFVLQPLINNSSTTITLWKSGAIATAVASEMTNRYFVGSAVYRAAS